MAKKDQNKRKDGKTEASRLVMWHAHPVPRGTVVPLSVLPRADSFLSRVLFKAFFGVRLGVPPSIFLG